MEKEPKTDLERCFRLLEEAQGLTSRASHCVAQARATLIHARFAPTEEKKRKRITRKEAKLLKKGRDHKLLVVLR